MSLLRQDLRTRHDDQAQRQRNKQRERRTAYRLVDIRDHHRCRACQRPGTEHHHIRGRVGRMAEHSSNLVLLCKSCHDLRHVKRVLIVTGNADAVLTFENTETGMVWDA